MKVSDKSVNIRLGIRKYWKRLWKKNMGVICRKLETYEYTQYLVATSEAF
jgi:hypothetical protein